MYSPEIANLIQLLASFSTMELAVAIAEGQGIHVPALIATTAKQVAAADRCAWAAGLIAAAPHYVDLHVIRRLAYKLKSKSAWQLVQMWAKAADKETVREQLPRTEDAAPAEVIRTETGVVFTVLRTKAGFRVFLQPKYLSPLT